MNIEKRRQAVRRRRVQPLKTPPVELPKAPEQSQQGPPAFLNQALGHVQAGQLDTAIDILKQYTEHDPLTAYSNLGTIYLLENRFQEAQDVLEKAFGLDPHSTGVAVGLAQAMASQDHAEQAVDTLLACLKFQRESQPIRVLIEPLIGYQAQERALNELESLHESHPDNVAIQFERARMLKSVGRTQEAEQAFLNLLEKQAHMFAYYELAGLYRDTERPSKAIASLQQAVTLYPDQNELYHDLGNAYIQAGLADQGVEILRQALEKAPYNQVLRSGFLQQSHHLPESTPEVLFEAYTQWGRMHASPSLSTASYDNQLDLDRVLRIGYISPDFRRHSVSYFIEPLLEAHHRDKVQIYGYGHVLNADDVTERLKGKFDHYCDIVTLDDQAVAEQVKLDGIDILVDLAGHTSGNRLGVMALKPAPIQVTYLGHPDTTGLTQIDYRITDAKAESERSRQCTTERLVDLPQGFLCYRPPEFAPDVTEAPFLKNGYVTFGSFNNQAKINRNMIALWSEILLKIPDARFLLKLRVADDEAVKAMYLECFEHYGVTSDRLDIHTCGSPEDHLACLGSVDIALDTYPYNGTTITCETLWMGVPVVTLKGDLHCSRVGYSLLSQLGMEFLAVDTTDQYVTMACALACKPEAISQMRDSMRLRMGASSLCKTEPFAGHVEAAYQHMWDIWCQKTLSDAHDTSSQDSKLTVDGLDFYKVAKTQNEDTSVGYGDKHIIKIKHSYNPRKLCSFDQEVDIIQHLNAQGCVSCPRLVSQGTLDTGERYYIQERVFGKRDFNVADLIFAMLEQKSFGVCQGDLKPDNLFFENSGICQIIDYDQAIRDDSMREMGNLEFLDWFNTFFVARWKSLGFEFDDFYSFGGFTRAEVLSLFKDGAFNLAATSLFQEQITTHTQSGIYHSLDSKHIYIDGARTLDERRAVLDDIQFQPDETILDVGCNTGLLCHYLHDKDCRVSGIDMDPKIILGAHMVANILGKSIQFDTLDLDVADIENTYDTICLFSVIHHVKEFDKATKNIAQKCRRIILECSLNENGAKPLQGRWIHTSGWQFQNQGELVEYLEQVFEGFKFQKSHGQVDRNRCILSFVKAS